MMNIEFNKQLFTSPNHRHEYILWFLVNCILCQIPLCFMYAMGIKAHSIFSSGLSYIFTLYISSIYMLISFRDKGEIYIFKRKGILTVISIIVIVIISGLLCIYPNIDRLWLKKILVNHPGISYSGIMFISVYVAFLVSKPSIDQYAEINIQEEKSQQELQKSKIKDKQTDRIQAELSKEDFS